MTNTLQINEALSIGTSPPSAKDLLELKQAGYNSIVNLRSCHAEPDQPLVPAEKGKESCFSGFAIRSHSCRWLRYGARLLVDKFREAI